MSRLKKLADTWQNVLEEEEEVRPTGFKPRDPDIIVSDIDPYYFVLFLESEFSKNLDNKFKRPDGNPYSQGYINTVKKGEKGVTADLLASVKEYIPNFEEEFESFLDFTLGREQPMDPTEVERLQGLAAGSAPANNSYSRFLVDVTGLNIEQIQDAIGGVDPNTSYVDENGKRKIHKDLLKIIRNVFGLKAQDFKDYNQSGVIPNTPEIEKLRSYYTSVTASSNSRLKKRA